MYTRGRTPALAHLFSQLSLRSTKIQLSRVAGVAINTTSDCYMTLSLSKVNPTLKCLLQIQRCSGWRVEIVMFDVFRPSEWLSAGTFRQDYQGIEDQTANSPAADYAEFYVLQLGFGTFLQQLTRVLQGDRNKYTGCSLSTCKLTPARFSASEAVRYQGTPRMGSFR